MRPSGDDDDSDELDTDDTSNQEEEDEGNLFCCKIHKTTKMIQI
jgi:hypothetical protein